MVGRDVSVEVGDWLLVGVRVAGTVALGKSVSSGVLVRTVALLQAVSQQQTIKITKSLIFLLFGDSKE
jgi:hypothetical protein